MTATNLPNTLLKLGLAIAKYRVTDVIGEEALKIIETTVTDIGGETVQATIDSIFASEVGQRELLKAANAADQYFRDKCKNEDLRQLFTMGYGNLLSVQKAIASLPEALDDETLRESLFKAFRDDAPKRISDEKINDGVNLYIECLQSALIPVQNFGLRIIHGVLKEISRDVKDIKADVKTLLEKTTISTQGNENIKLINEKFSRITSRNLRKIQTKIPGLKESLVRNEAILIEGQLLKGQHVVLTGEAGTGKSGIAARIAQNAINTGKATLLIDARDISTSQTEKDVREYLDLTEIKQICEVMGCRIILDQLDNIAGLRSAKIVVELIQELVLGIDGLELMAVCRNKELHERDLLSGLLSNRLAEVICNEITQDQVANVLKSIGVIDYSSEVLSFGKNLLNLELIGQIHGQQPDFDFSTLTDVVYLWDKYIDIWYVREGRDAGEEMFKYAANLSKLGLNHPDGIIEREMPAPPALQRLISWGIITFVDGRMFRFRHEKFQDYIYARDAADRLLLPQSILDEIPDYKSRNVFWWAESIYASRNSSMRVKFFEEVFNG